jgi:NAD(P)-dependent dehydrogenase (short-subunit alcohol dehydrogenase family)
MDDPGRSAFVSGGTGGLGGAVTTAFLAAGWRVVVPTHGPPPSGSHPALTYRQADLADPDDVAAAMAVATADPERPLRAVVNLVGGFAMGGRVHETPVGDFEAQLQVNLRPTYLVTAAGLPHLVAGGGGAVVCVSSRAAEQPFPGAVGYVTAKAALLAFTDVVALEYRQDGVRANVVLPSVIDTPANRAGMPNADFSRWVSPTELAATILYLCSDDAAAVSGTRVRAYGRA